MTPDLIVSAKRLVKDTAAHYKLKISEGQADTVARNVSTFATKQLSELRASFLGRSYPPYVINQWSEISVKRRSIFGKPSSTKGKGYDLALTRIRGDLIDLEIYGRMFPPDNTGSPHRSYLFVTAEVWKMDPEKMATLPHQINRKMVNLYLAATRPLSRQPLIDAGKASEYESSSADLRERCLRKSKKDQQSGMILADLKSPCGLTYSLRPVKDKRFGMVELSQILSFFGDGQIKVFVSQKQIVFSNHYFTYIIEWSK